MLAVIGEDSIESLLAHTVPSTIRMTEQLNLGEPRSPQSVHHQLRELAAKNVHRTSLIGMGYYGTIAPPVIVRNVLENPAWYTAYTPYQPEISQGRLEALLNFQTMVAELTGFDLANASLLDEATAAAEAMTMSRRLSRSDSNRFIVHHDTHPQTIAVLATRAEPVGIELVVGDVDVISGGCFGALFSLPTSSGAIIDWSARSPRCTTYRAWQSSHRPTGVHAHRAAPQLGADIAIGSAQRFGVSMGFEARTRPSSLPRNQWHEHCRVDWWVSAPTPRPPGDATGLQTREQHIRREGDVEHLHGAGPPREHRRLLRRAARARRVAQDRRACASAGLDRRAHSDLPVSISSTTPGSTLSKFVAMRTA
jgi:glycine dehydrogenase